WSNEDEFIDAAVLEIVEPSWPEDVANTQVRFGRVEGEGLLTCQVLGYAAFNKHYGTDDNVQVQGMIAPLANAKSGLLSINVTSPPSSRDAYSSPWSGMSGAPVICQSCLVGVVVNARTTGESLSAVRIDTLTKDRKLVDLIEKAIGRQL